MDRKDKNVAAVLAFFLGTFGVHRFYLGQIWLGILHCVFMFTGIPTIIGFIDAMVFFSMDQDRFDGKYNWRQMRDSRYERRAYREQDRWERRQERGRERRREREDNFERRRHHREKEIEHWEKRHRKRQREEAQREKEVEKQRVRQERKAEMQKKTTYKTEGIKRFKEYDYEGAIDCFERVLEIDQKDVAAHFNLACAYSLTEETKPSLHHLDQAVKYGFDDFQKIRTHDALAYLRIQEEFEAFAQSGFRLPETKSAETPAAVPTVEETFELELPQSEPLQVEAPKPDLLQSTPDLLDQLQKLGDLKERGVLSEEEFVKEKRKLLG
ncbi:MAG: NINE protein [Bacteroidota bacterium]